MDLSPRGRRRPTRDNSHVVTEGCGIWSYESDMTTICDPGPFIPPFFSKADVERDRPPASSHWLGILKFRARRAALWGYRSLTCRSPRSVPGQ